MADSDTRVVTASRGKLALMCLGSLAFCGIGWFLVSSHPSPKAVIAGWASLVFFGAAGVLAALQLIWPAKLVLDRNGLAFHYLFRISRRRWVDVRRIEVRQIKSTRIVKLAAKPGAGSDLALGGAWSLSTDDLVALLEGYLAKFGRANAA